MKNQSEKNALLNHIGTHVRALRLAENLTVKQFAAKSSLSPRFINQLESGEGNISIAGLARVAAALSKPLIEIIPPPPGDHSVRARTWRLLSECADDQLQELNQWLDERNHKTALPRFIALIGLRGAGKSTVGPMLAKGLKTEFVELDKWIEEAATMPLGEIFTTHGEGYYRRLERQALLKLFSSSDGCVLAPGGSIVTDQESWEMIKQRCFTVWLHATPEEFMRRMHKQGDTRAMQGRPRAMEELKDLLSLREPLYAESQVFIKTTKKSPAKIVELIMRQAKQR